MVQKSVGLHGKKEYLDETQFRDVKNEVRQCWRALGMLLLRMENDMEIGVRRRIAASDLAGRLRATAERIEKTARQIQSDVE